ATLRTDLTEEARPNPKLLGPAVPNPYYVPTDPTSRPSLEEPWRFERGASLLEGYPSPAVAERNFVVPDYREPRAHIDQTWAVWYEGALPGTEGRVADTRLDSSEPNPLARGFFDPSATFCAVGVHDKAAARIEGARLLTPDPSPQRPPQGHPRPRGARRLRRAARRLRPDQQRALVARRRLLGLDRRGLRLRHV
ncbi:MAG: hypothetical protein MUF34_23895, partial [Polyangiaceae bacterium]|nr:hypothetical protein [Polyangiaceae bacterium]